MLVQLQNPKFANERVGVNKHTYTADSKGVIVVEPDDEQILVSVGGWERIGEVDSDTRVRLPDTPDEFLAACRRMGLTPRDLRGMADFLEAHQSVEMLPAEPIFDDAVVALEPEPEPSFPDLAVVAAEEAEADEVEAGAATDEPIPEGNGNGDRTKTELLAMAKDMGIPADGRWGKRRILEAIEAERGES